MKLKEPVYRFLHNKKMLGFVPKKAMMTATGVTLKLFEISSKAIGIRWILVSLTEPYMASIGEKTKREHLHLALSWWGRNLSYIYKSRCANITLSECCHAARRNPIIFNGNWKCAFSRTFKSDMAKSLKGLDLYPSTSKTHSSVIHYWKS